jgi:hypothetical protein
MAPPSGGATSGGESGGGVPAGNKDGEMTGGQRAWNNAKPFAYGAGAFAGIYGASMLFPRAVGSVLFPFLPKEYQPLAACCVSCSSCAAVLALLVMMMVKR